MDKIQVKSVLEALLFINEKPIATGELVQVLEKSKREVESVLDELSKEYQARSSGICIVKVAGGYQMCTAADNELWVKKMYQERIKQKLSTASLETLAIIAYKQPITRVEIEAIRGVNVDGVVRKLTDLGLIKISGRKDVIGKPFLYITTRKFLEYFGINVLQDLPKLEDFIALAGKDLSSTPSNPTETQEKAEDNTENGSEISPEAKTEDKIEEKNQVKDNNNKNSEEINAV